MSSFPWRCSSQLLQINTSSYHVPGQSSTLIFPCQGKDNPKLRKGKKAAGEGRLLGLARVMGYIRGGVQKVSKGVTENLSPKQKGDWKDVFLMSISFAVYVYMSQMIVRAYCVWISSANL